VETRWFAPASMVWRAGKEAFITGTFIRLMRYEAE
jgi:hypothetical protein